MADVPDLMPISGGTHLLAARLCNFVTAHSAPLTAHLNWINGDLKKILLATPNAWVDIVGYASRLGSANYNQQLSYGRCEAVKKAIQKYAPKTGFPVEWAKGSTESGDKARNNDGYWRAVDVYLYGGKPSVKPTPPPHPPSDPPTHFEMRLVGGFSAGAVAVDVDDYYLQIVDRMGLQTAFYRYTGVGITLGVPKIPGPGSVSKAGPPTRFSTSRPATLWQFETPASLYQDPGGSLGPLSAGGTLRLTLEEITDTRGLIRVRPAIIPLSSDWGIAPPSIFTATKGRVDMVSGIFPFTGY